MKKVLNSNAARMLDDRAKKYIKAGLLADDLSFTTRGQQENDAITLVKNQVELDKLADEILAEEAKEETK